MKLLFPLISHFHSHATYSADAKIEIYELQGHLKSWQSLKWNLVTSQYPNFTSKLTNSRYIFRKNCFNLINKKVQYLFAWIIFPILKLKSNNDKLSRIFPKKIWYLIDFLRKRLKFDYSVCCV